MIWDFIRDFFVQFIFGGYTSDGMSYSGMFCYNLIDGDEYGTFDTHALTMVDSDGTNVAITIGWGDWLSTTATIICMCLIVFLLICLVRWIFRVVSSAFLLK